MSDDKPRKTLTVAPKDTRRTGSAASPRTGARARNASTLRPTTPAGAPGNPASRPARPTTPGEGASAGRRHPDRNERPGNPRRDADAGRPGARTRPDRPDGAGRAGRPAAEGRPTQRPHNPDGQSARSDRRPPGDDRPRPARSGAPRPPQRDAGAPVQGARRQDRSDRPSRALPNADRRPAGDNPQARPVRRAPQDARPMAAGSLRDRVTDLPPVPAQADIITGDATRYPVFAPCPQGLEALLADELTALDYADVRAGRAGCHFTADWAGVLQANLQSRLATRILVQVAHAPVSTEDDILALAAAVPWERWFGPAQSLRVDTSAVRSPMRSLQYCNLRAKDGICDRLRAREGARPSIDTVRPDARVHLFLDATSATLYLDTTGESLFKRGWRLDKGEAPLRENLAAGLLALSGWQPDQALVDPFCGSGTILIEAAWKALGVPAGIWRPFGFERLRVHDMRQWMDLKDAARARIASKLEVPLVGCDLDPQAIDAARQNLRRARLAPDSIHFEVNDACTLPPPAASGCIVTNPPYGERLASQGDTLWPAWASWLKQHYGGWQAHVVTAELDLPGRLRLQAGRRTPVRNGDLDCRLFSFDIVSRSTAA